MTPKPYFLKISDMLRREIAAGVLKPHMALPSERALAEKFLVSRMTARRALELLEHEGLAYNEERRGRFVSPPRLRYDLSSVVSLVANSKSRGEKLEIKVIETKDIKKSSWLYDKFEGTNAEAFLSYTRLFSIDGHAIFIETEYLVSDRFPDFLDHDLKQSTSQILDEIYETPSCSGDIVIKMCRLSDNEAGLLNIPKNRAAIELEQITRDTEGLPICLARQIWRGEMAEFSAKTIVN